MESIIKLRSYFLAVLSFCCVSGNLVAQETPLTATIAIVGPLTSKSNAFGIPHLQSATLAIDQYNKENSTRGRHINLQIYDDRSDGDLATNQILQIDASEAVAILGPANSSVAESIELISKRKNLTVPIVSAIATSEKLTNPKYRPDNFFRANVSDKKRIWTLLTTLFSDQATRPNKIALVYQKADAFGEGMRANAKEWIETQAPYLERSDLYEKGYDKDIEASDALNIAQDLKDKKYETGKDAVLLLGIASDAVTLIKAFSEKRLKVNICFNEPDENIFKDAVNRKIPIAGVRVMSVFYPDNDTDVNSFKDDFYGNFHSIPSFSAALTFDATRILLKFIDEAFTEKGDPRKNLSIFRQSIVTKLSSGHEAGLNYFVISGNHAFTSGEFVDLTFKKLKYNAAADLIPWGQELRPHSSADKPSVEVSGAVKSTTKLTIWPMAFIVMFFGYFGSVLRAYKIQSANPPINYFKSLFSISSLVIDPLIALVVAACLLAVLFFIKKQPVLAEEFWPLSAGAIAVGALSGFLGVGAIDAIVKRIGLSTP